MDDLGGAPPDDSFSDPFAPFTPSSSVGSGDRRADVWEPGPVPGEVPPANAIRHWKHGPASARWIYRDITGAPLFCVARFDLEGGEKQVLPYSYGHRVWTVASGPNKGKRRDVRGWHFKAHRSPRPLYGLQQLGASADNVPVLLVEGEKTADAAAILFRDMIVVTSQGGAKAADKADWDVLAGRHVVLWPDNDQAGQDYAEAVARLLFDCIEPLRVASIRQVSVPAQFGDGWDLADAAAEQADVLREMIDAAAPVNVEDLEPDCRPSGFTDEGLALRFTDKHGATLRYVAGWGKWMMWTGTHWEPDGTMRAFDYSRAICRRASSECNTEKVAAKVASGGVVAAVERLAKADRRHAATVEQWDADPWLLNTPGGTVDLRTGKMRKHRPEDHITKITAVAPGGECPMWHAFLETITANDAALAEYLKRVIGYCLTGSIREHALFFGFGTGANGKGVTLNTVDRIMGNYATTATMETFTASTSDRHPTDLAMLRGARLVAAQETEEGRRWAESRIKSMTGGDPITARFMRQDFFTYAPEFKLFIAGNHKPGLRGVDEAIRRRFNLIPFSVKIPPEQRDPDLQEKLQAEWPGILKWAIAGCLEWQCGGLNPPPAVLDATAEYLSAEDAAGNWQNECCVVDRTLRTSASHLYASWKEWAEAAGEFPGSQKGFSQKLVARGFEQSRMTGGKSGFVGLGIRASNASAGRYGDTE